METCSTTDYINTDGSGKKTILFTIIHLYGKTMFAETAS